MSDTNTKSADLDLSSDEREFVDSLTEEQRDCIPKFSDKRWLRIKSLLGAGYKNKPGAKASVELANFYQRVVSISEMLTKQHGAQQENDMYAVRHELKFASDKMLRALRIGTRKQDLRDSKQHRRIVKNARYWHAKHKLAVR